MPRRWAGRRGLLLLVAASGCRRGWKVPDKASPEYREAIRSFYVGLAALQVGDDSRAETDNRTQLRWSRISTLFWALLLFALAVLSLHKVSRVVEVGLGIASVAYGALLGVFLLGMLTRRVGETAAMAGMVASGHFDLVLGSRD